MTGEQSISQASVGRLNVTLWRDPRKLESISRHRKAILPPSLRQSLTVLCCFQSSGALSYKLYLWRPCQSKFYSKVPSLTYHQHLSHSEVVEGTQLASFLQNNTPTYIVRRPWALQTLSYGAEFTIGIANCKCFAISDPMEGVSLHLTRMAGGGRQKIAE